MNNFKTLSVPINSYLVPKNVISKQGAWGIGNSATKLGIEDAYGSGAPITTWTQLTKQDDWAKVSGYTNTMCVIKNDGSLWVSGNISDYYGAGTGWGSSISTVGSLTRIGTDSDWADVAVGKSAIVAIKANGTLWVSGSNSPIPHMLGVGADSPSLPLLMQIGTETTWASISATGSVHAIKTDGTLWAWGSDFYSNLGLSIPSGTPVYSPTQVGSLANWSKVSKSYSHTAAIKTDGTLWTWGANTSGQLGQNSGISTSSPSQVGALTDWSKVYLPTAENTYAIKTDGTLWAWGKNAKGALGVGNTISYSSPVQVGSLSNWKDVAVMSYSNGEYAVVALKTDGTLWAWGENTNNSLDLDTTATALSSPVQIGSDSTWSKVITGNIGAYVVATKTPYTSII